MDDGIGEQDENQMDESITTTMREKEDEDVLEPKIDFENHPQMLRNKRVVVQERYPDRKTGVISQYDPNTKKTFGGVL